MSAQFVVLGVIQKLHTSRGGLEMVPAEFHKLNDKGSNPFHATNNLGVTGFDRLLIVNTISQRDNCKLR